MTKDVNSYYTYQLNIFYNQSSEKNLLSTKIDENKKCANLPPLLIVSLDQTMQGSCTKLWLVDTKDTI